MAKKGRQNVASPRSRVGRSRRSRSLSDLTGGTDRRPTPGFRPLSEGRHAIMRNHVQTAFCFHMAAYNCAALDGRIGVVGQQTRACSPPARHWSGRLRSTSPDLGTWRLAPVSGVPGSNLDHATGVSGRPPCQSSAKEKARRAGAAAREGQSKIGRKRCNLYGSDGLLAVAAA